MLEVPIDPNYNISMMNKIEEEFWNRSIQESVSNVYWDFRDSLDDEGGERLKEECDHFEKMLFITTLGFNFRSLLFFFWKVSFTSTSNLERF